MNGWHVLSQYSDEEDLELESLKTELKILRPMPTALLERSWLFYYFGSIVYSPMFFCRTAICNNTEWFDIGLAVYYSYDDLTKSGRVSSDPLQPWKRISEDLLKIARRFKQIYITLWYPHRFGYSDSDVNDTRFINIIQKIIPTRTGLDQIKSDSVVWLSTVNGALPSIPQRIYRHQQENGKNV